MKSPPLAIPQLHRDVRNGPHWDRHVVTKGEAAKKTKQVINCQRIYPPLTGSRQEILAAAAPVVQQPPATYH